MAPIKVFVNICHGFNWIADTLSLISADFKHTLSGHASQVP
jgi:hypothetical protein